MCHHMWVFAVCEWVAVEYVLSVLGEGQQRDRCMLLSLFVPFGVSRVDLLSYIILSPVRSISALS
jgi:hypothetical protein